MENLIIGPKNQIIGLNKNLTDEEVLMTLIQKVDMRNAILVEAKKQGYTILKTVEAFNEPKKKPSNRYRTSTKGINFSGIKGRMEKKPVDVYNVAGILINTFSCVSPFALLICSIVGNVLCVARIALLSS